MAAMKKHPGTFTNEDVFDFFDDNKGSIRRRQHHLLLKNGVSYLKPLNAH